VLVLLAWPSTPVFRRARVRVAPRADDTPRLLRSQSVRFADHAEALLPRHCCSRHARSGSPQQKQSAFMRALQQREEGAVMALLQHQPTQQQLVVCSTHLHW
jgi:hypothetical protein